MQAVQVTIHCPCNYTTMSCPFVSIIASSEQAVERNAMMKVYGIPVHSQ